MTSVARWFHTIRHLRPIQIGGRFWFRLHRPRVDLRPAAAQRRSASAWRFCARAASMTAASTFRFLGVERTLRDAGDWNRADWPRLWSYNLHYFDDLAADATAEREGWHRALIARWIAENPPVRGTAWEPYPTSLRIVNWVKWLLAGRMADATMRDSLAVQARWLRGRKEIHLLGNHLWANAKALVFAGSLFEGGEAARWQADGLALVRRELAEQILADGGHFERSPMYHAIVLEDLLDLIQLAAVLPAGFDAGEVASWRAIAVRMLRWLRVMTHPDGGIALFNDAALGIAPDHAALDAYARQLGIESDAAPLAALETLPDSGYVRLQAGAAVLIADVGEIGPDYLPGHAHADTLSFELSLHGVRLLVNGGTSTYAEGAERQRQRGTAAHNTVQVDGEDSSEVWAGFRVARRARPSAVSHGVDADGLWLRASHDGYRRLPGRALHRRQWHLSERALSIVDEIQGGFREAVACVHVHPDWRIGTAGNADGRLCRGDDVRARGALEWRVHDAAATVVDGSYHPRFGVDLKGQVIVARFEQARCRFELSWA